MRSAATSLACYLEVMCGDVEEKNERLIRGCRGKFEDIVCGQL